MKSLFDLEEGYEESISQEEYLDHKFVDILLKNRHGISMICDPRKVNYHYEEAILQVCNVEGLIPHTIVRKEDTWQINYDIHGYRSLQQVCSLQELDYASLYSLVEGLFRTILLLEDICVEGYHLMLYPSRIYVRGKKHAIEEVKLLFCLEYQIDIHTNLKRLGEYLLDHIDFEQENAVLFGYSFYRMVAEGELDIRSYVTELLRKDYRSNDERRPARQGTEARHDCVKIGNVHQSAQGAPELSGMGVGKSWLKQWFARLKRAPGRTGSWLGMIGILIHGIVLILLPWGLYTLREGQVLMHVVMLIASLILLILSLRVSLTWETRNDNL